MNLTPEGHVVLGHNQLAWQHHEGRWYSACDEVGSYGSRQELDNDQGPLTDLSVWRAEWTGEGR
jgi:hypothetical protein